METTEEPSRWLLRAENARLHALVLHASGELTERQHEHEVERNALIEDLDRTRQLASFRLTRIRELERTLDEAERECAENTRDLTRLRDALLPLIAAGEAALRTAQP